MDHSRIQGRGGKTTNEQIDTNGFGHFNNASESLVLDSCEFVTIRGSIINRFN